MRSFSLASGLATAAVLASSVSAALDPIVIKGSKFFYKSNGTEFFMRGVAYQQEYSTNASSTTGTVKYTDPLADAARCKVDIPLLQQLNTNTIRVYAVNPSLDHSVCMDLLQKAGIYIVADLSEPGLSINRDSPAWNDALYTRYTAVVDMFAPYTNVIGFFAGNEVSNNKTNTNASAYVKAAVRDMKTYIKNKNYRTMYVGYATNDDADIRENMANYFNCGDQSAAIDFWGYNIYSWCGDSSFTTSGFDQRVKEFENYSVPSFFAEYGCNTVTPRKFTEVQALFGSQMTGTFSGGIMYMYFQEENKYGLVDVRGGSLTKLADYTYYSSQMNNINPTGVAMSAYNPSNSPAACPAVQSGTWEAKSSPLPPPANPSLCSCMYSSLACVVKASVNETTYGKLFNQVCGYGSSCAGILSNARTGSYGAYSVCNATEQLSFAFNQYYNSQNKAADACNFGGAASLKTGSSAQGSCSTLLAQAGSQGTGSVSAGSSSSGGSSSGSSGNSTSRSAAGGVTIPPFNYAVLGMGVYVSVAAFLGAGIILL